MATDVRRQGRGGREEESLPLVLAVGGGTGGQRESSLLGSITCLGEEESRKGCVGVW